MRSQRIVLSTEYRVLMWCSPTLFQRSRGVGGGVSSFRRAGQAVPDSLPFAEDTMKTLLPLFIGILLVSTALAEEQDLKLWYTKPATKWDEALPLGNGRLGAMVFGGVDRRASATQRGHARFRLSRLPRPAARCPQGFLHGHRSDCPSPLRRGRQARDREMAGGAPGPATSRWATCSSISSTRGRRRTIRRELDLAQRPVPRPLRGRRREVHPRDLCQPSGRGHRGPLHRRQAGPPQLPHPAHLAASGGDPRRRRSSSRCTANCPVSPCAARWIGWRRKATPGNIRTCGTTTANGCPAPARSCTTAAECPSMRGCTCRPRAARCRRRKMRLVVAGADEAVVVYTRGLQLRRFRSEAGGCREESGRLPPSGGENAAYAELLARHTPRLSQPVRPRGAGPWSAQGNLPTDQRLKKARSVAGGAVFPVWPLLDDRRLAARRRSR